MVLPHSQASVTSCSKEQANVSVTVQVFPFKKFYVQDVDQLPKTSNDASGASGASAEVNVS